MNDKKKTIDPFVVEMRFRQMRRRLFWLWHTKIEKMLRKHGR